MMSDFFDVIKYGHEPKLDKIGFGGDGGPKKNSQNVGHH